MTVCPRCNAVTPAGAASCPSCGVARLEAEAPDFVTVFESSDPVELSIARSILDEAGIPFATRGADFQELFGIGRIGTGFNTVVGPTRIEVPARSGDRAAILLDAGLRDVRSNEGTSPRDSAPHDVGEATESDAAGGEIGGARSVDPPLSVPLPGLSRALRLRDLVMVLLLTYGLPIGRSIWLWWADPATDWSLRRYALTTAFEVAGLLLLIVVLARRGQSLRDLGLRSGWIDVPAGFLLAITGQFAALEMLRVLTLFTVFVVGHPSAPAAPMAPLVGTPLQAMVLVAAVLAAVERSLILCAFTISEGHALTQRVALPVLASVFLQSSLRLHNGWLSAGTNAAVFLLYAAFYARFRRITPVIVANVAVAVWTFWPQFRPN